MSQEKPSQFTFNDLPILSEDKLIQCSRCGFCLPACPTYRETGLEVQSPRGRVALIRAAAMGELPLSDNLAAHMYHCLDCRACQTVCPSGVKPGEMVAATRAVIEKGKPKDWRRRLVLDWVLPHPNVMETLMWPLRLYQWSGLQWLVRHGLGRLLPPPLRRLESLLPEQLPRKPLRRALPEVVPAHGQQLHRVGFFLGCVMSLVYAKASSATVSVLSRNGCEVVTPRAVRCCGAPHESEGALEKARELARQNIAVFEKWSVDVITADCAACSAMLKAYGHLLEDDPQFAQRARAFSSRVKDITEFLAELPLGEALAPVRKTVTYHEPCHLAHAQGVSAQPRKLLRSVPGLELREMAEANACCGSAGSYMLSHPERSQQILERKLDNIAASGAQVVATGNPGCLLYLEAGVRRRGLKVDVVHPVQLLAEAYEKAEREGPGA